MPRYEDLDPESQAFFRTFPSREDGDPPWAPLGKPLGQCKVALITSSGLIRKSDVPFDLVSLEGDPSYRVVPADTDPSEFTFSHLSPNWDRAGAAMDLNVIFPLQRFRELAEEGVIGSVADEFYAFMGAVPNTDPIVSTSAPEVGRLLRAAAVDVAFLVPT